MVFLDKYINSAPAEFTLVAPEQDEETSLAPTFNWNESSDADLYDEIAYTLSYGTDPSDLSDITSSVENNYSLSFDGSNYININNPGNFTTSTSGLTIDLSFKISDIPSDGGEFLLDWGAFPGSYVTDHIFRMAFYGTELKIWIEGNGYLNHPNNLIYDFSEDLDEIVDNWVKVTVVYNIGQSKLFINGLLTLEVENFMEEGDAYTIFDQAGIAYYYFGNNVATNRGLDRKFRCFLYFLETITR